MIYPRKAKVPITALGTSVGTNGVIEADVVVVKSFSDLQNNYNSSVKGKIVVFNYEYTTYWKQVNYRIHGPFWAAKYGAVAALIRSVTPFSLKTPHTGMTHYRRGIPKIPAIAITVEDAHLFQRFQVRNWVFYGRTFFKGILLLHEIKTEYQETNYLNNISTTNTIHRKLNS